VLAELKERSQVTIPKSVVTKLGLQTGDQFEIITHNGEIHLVPVIVYPKSKIEKLEKLAAQAEAMFASGVIEVFDGADDAITSLHVSA